MLNALDKDPGAQYCYTYTVEFDDIYQAFIALVMDCPEFVGLANVRIYYSESSALRKLEFKYCNGQAAGTTAVNSYNAVLSVVEKVVKNADGLSTYNKLKYFAEYLCDNVVYDDAAYKTSVGVNSWNAYGSLVSGLGVCESYAEGYKLLCDEANIPCMIVVSDTHEWNAVYLDGAWYYVDTTWMDGPKTNGLYNYKWFLTGTDAASDKDHVLSSSAVLTGFNNITYPAFSRSAYPVAASGVTATVSGTEVYLSWNMVSGSADYWVLIREESDTEWYSLGKTTNNFCTVTDLVGGRTYHFMVCYNRSGDYYTLGEATVTISAIDRASIEAFVDRLYTIILGRHAEAGGLATWTNDLAMGKHTSAEIVYGIANSQEFKNQRLSNDEVIERMYRAMLGRESDASGKQNWLNAMANGMTVTGIINGFSGSKEFANVCAGYGILPGTITECEPRDRNSGLTSFVSRMYTEALGRNYDVDGLNTWTDAYLRREQDASGIAYGFIFSDEFKLKNHNNNAYVDILYRTFFGRNASSEEKAGWVNMLNAGETRESVLDGFLGSEEFANLKAGFGV